MYLVSIIKLTADDFEDCEGLCTKELETVLRESDRAREIDDTEKRAREKDNHYAFERERASVEVESVDGRGREVGEREVKAHHPPCIGGGGTRNTNIVEGEREKRWELENGKEREREDV